MVSWMEAKNTQNIKLKLGLRLELEFNTKFKIEKVFYLAELVLNLESMSACVVRALYQVKLS